MPRHGPQRPGTSERAQWRTLMGASKRSERCAGALRAALRVERVGKMAASDGLAGGRCPACGRPPCHFASPFNDGVWN
jgi:hypothetical protein